MSGRANDIIHDLSEKIIALLNGHDPIHALESLGHVFCEVATHFDLREEGMDYLMQAHASLGDVRGGVN